MVKQRLLKAISLFSLFYIFLSTPFIARGATNEEIVVGVSTPLTGDLAVSGTDAKNALEFANEYFFQGKYRFIIQDDACNPAQGRSVAMRFTSIDRIKYVLGMYCNAVLLNTAPIYSKAGTLLITAGATSGDVQDVGPSIFRPYPADHFAAIELARYVGARFKKIGIITELDEYTSLMERHFTRVLRENVPTIAIESVEVDGPSSDFKAVLLRLKERKVDAIFLNTMSEPSFLIALRQARQLGVRAEFLANLFPASEVVLKEGGGFLEGVKFSNVPLLDETLNAKGREIYGEFTKRYGTPQSAPLIAMLSIDSLRLLDRALQSGKNPAEFIRNVKFDGLAGPIEFDKYGAVTSIKYEIQEIRGGKPTRLEK